MGQKFSKYHGAGNDFIMIDNRRGGFDASRAQVAALCSRRTGIGADGLMLLEDDDSELFRMRYFNADGGESTMCGNGGRCIVLFAHHLGIGGLRKRFSGIDGVHDAQILSADAAGGEIRLGMIDVSRVEKFPDHYFLDTGSPHHVEFVPDVRRADVARKGAMIRRSDPYAAAGGTNVNFAEIVSDGRIRVRTYERGVEAETLACGTGATASALATAVRTGSDCRNYRVDVEGGVLFVSFDRVDAECFTNVTLTGPAQKVFDGCLSEKF